MKNRPRPVAGDIMKAPVIAVSFETPVREAADILSSNGISGALVTGRNGEAVGVVSLFDIVSFLAGLDRPPGAPGGFYEYVYPDFEEDGGLWEAPVRPPDEKPVAETPVGDIMATSIISVPSGAELEEVAALMVRKHVHRVFVRQQGEPVGVLSSMDVLRAFPRGPARGARRRGGGPKAAVRRAAGARR
ncbi:MAG: CBS domain-containing protein [Planctomycetia bacterium]|nr:CBS domain-containing protein [Planctomycetia bacterium]